jgi:hypothetical protein
MLVESLDTLPDFVPISIMVLPVTFRDSPFAVSMSRCDGLNVGMLFMSLKKLVEIRVTVAPVYSRANRVLQGHGF